MATKQELEERLEKALEQNEELVKKAQENNNTISTDILENEKLCNVLLLKRLIVLEKKLEILNLY